jgi:hypothetical protein
MQGVKNSLLSGARRQSFRPSHKLGAKGFEPERGSYSSLENSLERLKSLSAPWDVSRCHGLWRLGSF